MTSLTLCQILFVVAGALCLGLGLALGFVVHRQRKVETAVSRQRAATHKRRGR